VKREPEENIHAALAALADGTPPDEQRRDRLLARVAESPELATELADQRRAVALLGSLESVRAPDLLRRSIELAAGGEAAGAAQGGSHAGRFAAASSAADGAGAARARRSRDARGILRRSPRPESGDTRLRRRSPFRPVAVGLLAAAAAIVLALVLATGAGTGAPSVLQASRAGLRAATGAAPAESRRHARLLAASAAGIPYPYWGGGLGWSAAGTRADTILGRTVTTVFYANRHGQRIGYSIVSGEALPIPAGSAAVQSHGVSFAIVRRADPTVLTWREAGHTCILTARGVGARTLTRLAAWGRA
jgi:hypothetical protein